MRIGRWWFVEVNVVEGCDHWSVYSLHCAVCPMQTVVRHLELNLTRWLSKTMCLMSETIHHPALR